MAFSERTGFFSSRRVRRTPEELRSLLRVVPGGKAAAGDDVDRRPLDEDRFLREHFLDRSYPSSIIVTPPGPFNDAG